MDRYETTFQTWDQLASMYQDKFMELNLYNDTYDAFCRFVEKADAHVLEIGCGPGNITRYLTSKRPDFQIIAIDVAPNMIQLARQNNPAVGFKVMDGREISTLTDKFDAVLCGFCMPYLSKPDCIKLIKDSAHLLNNNGIFYFSAIEGDYLKSGYETSSDGQYRMYVYHHQEDYLKENLQQNDFELLALTRKHYVKADGTSAVHIIFIARKKEEM